MAKEKDWETGTSKANMEKCRCGGEYGFDEEQCGLIHSLPPCKAFEDLDPAELGKTPGATFRYIMKHLKWMASA